MNKGIINLPYSCSDSCPIVKVCTMLFWLLRLTPVRLIALGSVSMYQKVPLLMDGLLTKGKYPDKIRRIKYWDDENKREFVFITNALDISPMMVAELYHQRWQIELFFKWLKQHLKIKKFWGNSENAVRIQIYSAIVSYCMMAIVQKKMGINRSIF